MIQHSTEYAADLSVHRSVYTDNVLPHMLDWMRQGRRSALVTLIGIDGAAPRSLGAQMAVSDRGEWAGYISGGCLEQAIVLEAIEAMKDGRHRLIRYGKGSPYFDVQLPCGSGLDIFIQPNLEYGLLERMCDHVRHRRRFSVQVDLKSGHSHLQKPGGFNVAASHRDSKTDTFRRTYTPAINCLVIGASPIAVALSELGAVAGLEVNFHTPDDNIGFAQNARVAVHPLTPPYNFRTDPWTAAILAFHDHDRELPVLAKLLRSDCFFIAAIGSRNAHSLRETALADAGYSASEIARVKSPAGLIPGLKSAPLVAVSIIAQVIEMARAKNLLTS